MNLCNRKDLYLDRVYKLCAPLMLGFVAYSYVFSVKPVFDKQQELNEKSSLVETLTSEVKDLEGERNVALSQLQTTQEKLSATSVDLKERTESLEKTSSSLNETQYKLDSTERKLSNLELKLENTLEEITSKETRLAQLQLNVDQKNKELQELTKSLNSSENAAVTFYVYRVVNEVVNDGIHDSVSLVYRNSDESDRFNLYNALMKKAEVDENEKVDKYSQKYYENQAKALIKQFTEEKVSTSETGYKIAFDLYPYVFKKQMGMSTE
ncbi:hypothetical protein AYI99_00285 [Shewanella algae]|nr:hypothetical protein AYI99_00285 [Shewanella algae]